MKDICKIGKKTFRYNRQHCVVEHVIMATKEMFADNTEWQNKFGKDLWEIDENGYYIAGSIGLRPENWDDKEARAEYLNEWAYELDEEADYLVAEAVKEFL